MTFFIRHYLVLNLEIVYEKRIKFSRIHAELRYAFAKLKSKAIKLSFWHNFGQWFGCFEAKRVSFSLKTRPIT